MKKLSRRSFIRLSGAAAAGSLLAASGCAGTPAAPIPTLLSSDGNAPVLDPEQAATQALDKTYRRPEIIKFYPQARSQVVRARNPDVWQGDRVSADIVRKMLDDALIQLTGKPDIKTAWQALFNPDERIAIKVNTFSHSTTWTHVELVKAATDGLQEAGIPGENIFIYDAYTNELKDAGFQVNRDGPGVRCFGTDLACSSAWTVGAETAKLSDILTSCDALINMPVLKAHWMAGYTFALKNHLGSVYFPEAMHQFSVSMPGLNGLKPIKDATRLVIGDAIHASRLWSYSLPYWSPDTKGDSILVSYDPAACDAVAMQILSRMIDDNGGDSQMIQGLSAGWMAAVDQAGLGTTNMENIELIEM